MSASTSTLAEEALRTVEREWNAASSGWNPDQFAALYTEDALFFGGRPGLSVGRDAVRGYFASYVGILKSTRMQLVHQHLRVLGPDTVLAQGYVRFQFDLVDGHHSSNEMRTTLVMVRREGRWQILQHHFSVTPDAIPIPR